MQRRDCLLIFVMLFVAPFLSANDQPNVLLISIDDLNDWVGCLEGHPQASTPHIDALAARSMLFRNAHCQAPVCQPSRASLMVSRFPSSTGLYFLNPGLPQSEVTKDVPTMPEAFAAAGYQVLGAGKLFHNRDNARVFNSVGEYGGGFGGFGPRPEKKISQPHGHPLWDWGAFPDRVDDMPDFKIASWAQQKLKEDYDRPFFLAVGFYRPHVPMFAPQRWFDQHPRDQIQLPLTSQNDTTDLSPYARNLTTLEHVAPEHDWVVTSGEWPHAVQAYLASTSFVDQCVGMVLGALSERPDAKNTLVCLFSDHGFHLGEKERWAKRSLWEDGTRVPLLFAGPSIEPGICDRPAGLIDIFPTLLDLTGQPKVATHEGQSLKLLIKDPSQDWNRPAMTTFGRGNHAIRSTRWRFIHYVDGSEELYDHSNDPNEWNNLAGDQRFQNIMQNHRRWLPTSERPILGSGSTGHKAYAAAQNALEAARHEVE